MQNQVVVNLIIGLVPNVHKTSALRLAKQIYQQLVEEGTCVWLEQEAAGLLQLPESSCPLADLSRSEVIISLGGDGTLLHTARALATAQVPILGINLGQLGFLTELEEADLSVGLQRLLRKEYDVERRLMLEAVVTKEGRESRYLALNDVVITRGTLARIITLSVLVSGQHVADYTADGVIVATPTGSTAYSLSAGGPIVAPSLESILITPICPHSLSSRSVLVPANETVEIRVEDAHGDVILTADGQTAMPLSARDVVYVAKAPWCAHFVRMHRHNFYEVVYHRLGRREVKG